MWFLNNWYLDKSVAITFLLQHTIFLSAAIEVSFAANEREISKDENIFNNCHDAVIIFLPFVAITFGIWVKITKYIISSISKRWADKHMENRDNL